MKRHVDLISVAGIIPLFVGCLHGDVQSRKAESWLTKPPPESYSSKVNGSSVVGVNQIHRVPAANIRLAINMLRHRAWVQITHRQASLLTGREMPIPAVGDIYLVRGVVQNKENGSFLCTYYDRRLDVFFGSTGRLKYPFEKEPIIICLPSNPKQVYVGCCVLE